MSILEEIKQRIKQGYRAELTFNYRTGNYEVNTWLFNKTAINQKLFKIPPNVYDLEEVVNIVYGSKRVRR